MLNSLKKLKIENILITLAYPVGMFIVMSLMLLVLNKPNIILSSIDIRTIIRDTGIAATIAFALSFNLTSGRLDLSLGSQRLVGTIIGANLALSLGLTGVWLLVFAAVAGLLFGFIVGMIFVMVRIPSLILGIGMGLILETVAYLYSDGIGLNLFGREGIDILKNIEFTILIVVVVATINLIMMAYTRYGYHLKAIQGSQRVAMNSGIKVFKHAVLSYTFAGGFVAISGVLFAAYNTQMEATLGFASNGPIVANIFPMMLGGYIGRKSNAAIGIITAALSLRIFSISLSRMALSESTTAVFNMLLFVLFLIWLANENVFKHRKEVKNRIIEAKNKRLSLVLQVNNI
jgi:ribose transport system permease protein